MPEPQQLPCTPWTTVDKMCCPDLESVDGPCVEGEPTPATYVWTDDELIGMASKILFEKTGRRFPGECEVTLRPCDPCRTCAVGCCGCSYEFIPLAGVYPVLDVSEVLIDTVAVPPASYRVDEYLRLVRLDGQSWPRWQNLGADPSVLGERTFQITYTTGRAVPADLQYAAALLACELKRVCNGQGCKLPDRVQSVVRDGVSYQVLDSAEVAFNGSFGVPIIDAIVKNYKPEKPRPNMTTRIFHPLLDGEAYADHRGVRG